MRFVIVGGAGAMGGVWAVGLAVAGYEVAVLDVARAGIAAIARDGVTVEEPVGRRRKARVMATADASAIGVCDAAIFFPKAPHTRAAAELARAAVGPGTTVVTLQNGWGSADALAEVFPPEQIAIGVTYQGATSREPGRVSHTLVDGMSYLGPYLDVAPLDRARAVGEAMGAAGLPATTTATVKTEIWKKLILASSGLPVSALTRLTTGELGRREAVWRVREGLTIEATAVARAMGYAIEEGERIEAMRALFANGGDGKTSMLQDVEAQRATEIAFVNGAVAREGRARGSRFRSTRR